MASVKKCDSCGAYYIRNTMFKCRKDGGCVSGIATINGAGRVDQKFDLCDSCVEKLWDWLSKSREDPETITNIVTVKDNGILYPSKDICKES